MRLAKAPVRIRPAPLSGVRGLALLSGERLRRNRAGVGSQSTQTATGTIDMLPPLDTGRISVRVRRQGLPSAPTGAR